MKSLQYEMRVLIYCNTVIKFADRHENIFLKISLDILQYIYIIYRYILKT